MFGMVNRLFLGIGVRISPRTYAPPGGARLVAPGFGESRPSHMKEDPWQPQRVPRAHEVLRHRLLKDARSCWDHRRPSREYRLDQ